MKKHRGTVLIGLVDKNSIWLGADDMAVGKNDFVLGINKFFERKNSATGQIDWIAVSAGSVRSAQIFEEVSKEYIIESEADIYGLAQNILNAHSNAGLGKSEDGEMPTIDAEFLLATPLGLHMIYDDLCFIKYKDIAVGGIGGEYAKAVTKLQYGKIPARKVISNAIDIAGQLSPYCSSTAIIKEFRMP